MKELDSQRPAAIGGFASDLAMLRLLAAEGIGPAIARRLVDHFGSPQRAVEASVDEVGRMEGLSAKAASLIVMAIARSNPADELKQLQACGGRFVGMSHPEFPEPLLRIPDPPALLRLQGAAIHDQPLAVSIVGTRRCSPYGHQQVGRFASALASAGVMIVSGGARGIDAEAHRGALRVGGRTVVVLGSGLAQRYPPEHERLFDEIVASGGTILSEYSTDRPPRPAQFPRRNRIVSGLSLGVLIIEAPRRSGAMITARLAVEEQGRDAWALPGRVDHRTSQGCHLAIAQGWAALVDSPDAMLQWMEDAGWFHASR